MSLDVVTTLLLTTLRTLGTPAGGSVLKSVRYGEQFQVGPGPEMWVLNTTDQWPQKEGSNVEQSDWSFELRVLFPFANDTMNAEVALTKTIEPIRQLFRSHLKIGDTTGKISWARPGGASWSWMRVNDITYRVVSIRLTVREKYGVSVTA